MKTRFLTHGLPRFLLLGLFLGACDDIGESNDNPLGDFQGYQDWPILSTDHIAPEVLGSAHEGDDPRFTRVNFGNVRRSGNHVLEGSVVVMETSRQEGYTVIWPEALGIVAMRKLAPGSSPESDDWEWFELALTRNAILQQGTNLGGGSCNSCHGTAEDAGALSFAFCLQPESTSFTSSVLPIFQQNCVSCHGGTNGLTLSSWASTMAGGNSGAVVVPGDAVGSLLYQKINGMGGIMPPSGPPLSSSQIATIGQWIDEGAGNN